jgi:hypothetical protein
MGTEFLFSRIAGGISTYLVGTVAEQHGLTMPMLVVVAVCLAAWCWAHLRRVRIDAAFAGAPPATAPLPESPSQPG